MRHGLLTTSEAYSLITAYQTGLQAEKTLSNNGHDHMQKDELQHLATRGKQALDLLTRANLRLVFSIARKYSGHGVDIEDLFNNGVFGFMTACKKFDIDKNLKLSTYASYWIDQAVRKAITNESRVIRLPIHVQDRWLHLSKIRDRLWNENGKEPSFEEIAAEAGMKTDRVERIFLQASSPASLEEPVSEEGKSEMIDFIADQKIASPEEVTRRVILREALSEAFQSLPSREIRILELRFGLTDGNPLTLEQIGRRMGMSRERVRQIEAQAMEKLRDPSRAEKLRPFLL